MITKVILIITKIISMPHLHPIIAHPPLTNPSPPFPDESDAASRGKEGLANLETEGRNGWNMIELLIILISRREGKKYGFNVPTSLNLEQVCATARRSMGWRTCKVEKGTNFAIWKLQVANQVMISINLQKREEMVKSFCWKKSQRTYHSLCYCLLTHWLS